MDIDNDGKNEGVSEMMKNGLDLYPVSPQASGEGLPYAPEDWPQPGDKWRWKVGKRVAASGYFQDRYLYLPKRLKSKPMGRTFASKLSVEQYVRTYANADVKAFFDSFSWKIPAVGHAIKVEHSGSDSQPGSGSCKAGNRLCRSLVESEDGSTGTMFCDICCSVPGFCRDCCCILCDKTVDSAYGGYNSIRCEAPVDGDLICGHVAHIECALRCYLAGIVGGRIGLDAEYYCRRCDKRTDLVLHVTKLLQTCESVESPDVIMKMLNLGASVMCGSERHAAKKLLHRIELVIGKLNSEACLNEVWKVEDSSAINPGLVNHHENDASESAKYDKPSNTRAASPQKVSESFDPVIESLKLETEVDQVLQALKKSQKSEYDIVQERLYEQKNYLQNLYQQLNEEKAELARQANYHADTDTLFKLVVNRADQIKREIIKLKEMEEVANGFGKTSKVILKEHFGLDP